MKKRSSVSTLTSRVILAAATLACIGSARAAENSIERLNPLIANPVVSPETQRSLGLVTVAGRCSGTLLNRYWVLTADRCVAATTDVRPGGPSSDPSRLLIRAAWSSETVTPTRVVRYWNSHKLDVALIFLGSGDFGETDRRQIYPKVVTTSTNLTKFGRGLFTYARVAKVGKTKAAQSDGSYRSAQFTPSKANELGILLTPSSETQIANAGDSGGPDYVTAGAGGAVLSIASVQSTCEASGYRQGMPHSWEWATGIKSCTSAALFTIRDNIHRAIAEQPSLTATSEPRPGGRVPTGTVTQVATPDVAVDGAACKSDFVWRAARVQDRVCVTPAARSRTARENAEAATRVNPAGAHGAKTCVAGYVWREAFPGDQVCVSPQARALVLQENSEASGRTVAGLTSVVIPGKAASERSAASGSSLRH